MVEVRFQNRLLDYINGMTVAMLPHTTLLCGEKGCGKHLVCNYMSEYFKLPLRDITEGLTLDVINEIYLSSTPAFYLIDMNKITVKEQNVILKFLEEPSPNAYILLLVNNANMVLDTIVNRCIRLDFEKYTPEQLQTFVMNGQTDCLPFCATPGDVLSYQTQDLELVTQFAEKVILKLGSTTIPNALFGIPKRLAFEHEQTKINVELFIKSLKMTLYKMIVDNKPLYQAYLLTNRLLLDCQQPKMNVSQLFDVYLIEMREILKKELEA